jgi:hypothetical protein
MNYTLKMELIPLNKLFSIKYGNSFDLNVLEECDESAPDRVNYVSRTRENNGVSAYVRLLDEVKPFKAGLITVAGSGNSVLEAFIQKNSFYTGYHVFLLEPLTPMTEMEKFFYCYCIRRNQYKYSFGRQANKTLKDILVPSKADIPDWVYRQKPTLPTQAKAINKRSEKIDTAKWKWFELQKLFIVKKGKRLTKADMISGNVPFIGAIDKNNGYREFIGQEPIHKGNTITVNYNGSVAEAFYQPNPFNASDDVNVLYPRFKLNPYIAFFIVTVIKQERYRFNYGRKWHMERMKVSEIKLPADKDGDPDYQFMENYVKSLPYSSSL